MLLSLVLRVADHDNLGILIPQLRDKSPLGRLMDELNWKVEINQVRYSSVATEGIAAMNLIFPALQTGHVIPEFSSSGAEGWSVLPES